MSESKLSYEERKLIYKYRRQGLGINQIGKELGRAGSTISRECQRNGASVDRNQDYFTQARAAQDATHARRVTASSNKIRLKSKQIQEYIELELTKDKKHKSIISIVGRWNIIHPEMTISHEAVYQWIIEERPDLMVYLPIMGKSKRRRVSGKKRRSKPVRVPKKSIELRPAEVENRDRIGDVEQDTIVCSQSKESIMNVTDRASRKVFLEKVPSLESESYSDVLIARIKKEIPEEHRHTVTQDNGPENAKHQKVEKALEIESFSCHPYCASERGTVERMNREVRVSVPKGTDISTVSKDELQSIESSINTRPMRVLGFLTPDEVWDYAINNNGLVPKQGSDAFNEACLRVRHYELNRIEIALAAKAAAQIDFEQYASLKLAA